MEFHPQIFVVGEEAGGGELESIYLHFRGLDGTQIFLGMADRHLKSSIIRLVSAGYDQEIPLRQAAVCEHSSEQEAKGPSLEFNAPFPCPVNRRLP